MGTIYSKFCHREKSSSSSKEDEHKDIRLKMISGSFYMPKQRDNKPLGEDAHFICEENNTIGVAYGVGGTAIQGIDSGEYARELMRNSYLEVLTYQTNTRVNPMDVLKKAFSRTNFRGSSTICIVTLHDKYIHAVNVGDSGFMVVSGRKIKTKFCSPIQQHRFNTPYQLEFKGYKSFDCLERGCEIKFCVNVGDVIITATDGLFDNMFRKDVEKILRNANEKGLNPQETANMLGRQCHNNSDDKSIETPFSLAASKEGINYKGGKRDDITIIVSKIIQE